MGRNEGGGASGTRGRAREVVAPAATFTPVPPPAPPAAPQANVRQIQATIDITQSDRQKVTQIFGRELSDNDLAGMVGAQDGSRISVQAFGNEVYFQINHPNIDGQSRILRKDEQGFYIYNSYFATRDGSPPGFGTKVFSDQVANARRLGINRIKVSAAGSINDSTYNGYYTWPRLGYNGPIQGWQYNRLPPEIRATMRNDSIQELYKTKAGREWWKQNGEDISLEFDTRAGSVSSRVLDAYNEERKRRG